MSLQRTRLPDYSIGATVLMVAIALPFFIFTRAAHLHRVGATVAPTATPAASLRIVPSPDPSRGTPPLAVAAPSQPAAALPLTDDSRAAHPRIVVRTSGRPAPVATSTPTSTPPTVPPPPPDFPPVVLMSLSTTDGPAPLAVSVDASGSSDTDQTPIAQIFVSFGDGTTLLAGSDGTAEHTYSDPGYYTLTVVVIDTARNSSSASVNITVS